MKVKVNLKPIQESSSLKFPKLMISLDTNSIVYFEKRGVGVKLFDIDGESLTYHTDWNMEQFVDFEGSIKLKN